MSSVIKIFYFILLILLFFHCTKDLGIRSKAYACHTNSECLPGCTCMATPSRPYPGICVCQDLIIDAKDLEEFEEAIPAAEDLYPVIEYDIETIEDALTKETISDGQIEEASASDQTDTEDVICLPSLVCDDANPCTYDLLCSENCIHIPHEGVCSPAICNKNTFYPARFCKGGKCEDVTPIKCDDDNICTDDTCDASLGCVYVPNKNECAKGFCSQGYFYPPSICEDGICPPQAKVSCNDNNQCTEDVCIPSKGCIHTIVEKDCDDGDPCTLGDKCIEGQCIPSKTLNCDDNNPCTKDICEQETCKNEAVDNIPCDDKNMCTIGDQCKGGGCVGVDMVDCDDKDQCTDDYCYEKWGCGHSAHEYVMTEDFSKGFSSWIPFGEPVIVDVATKTSCLDSKGDKGIDGGLISINPFGSKSGFTVESSVFLDFFDQSGCYAEAMIGMCKDSTSVGICPMAIRVSMVAEGKGCISLDPNISGHAWLTVTIFTDENLMEVLPKGIILADKWLSAWHKLGFQINKDGNVQILVDGIPILNMNKKIHPSVFEGRPLVIGGQSSGWAGKAYHDDVKVFTPGCIDMPLPSCVGETFKGHLYAFCPLSTKVAWATSQKTCVNWGGNLVVINDEEEQHFLSVRLKTENAWIGYNDQMNEGEWVWVDGSANTFTNWCEGEPNNLNNEDFAIIDNTKGGCWIDCNLSSCQIKGFICERL